jgi:nicotinamidase/pyrazinamidase
MIKIQELLQPANALLIIDVQIDFCPGGALPIAQGDRVVSVLNRWISAALSKGIPIYASRDWHPLHHISFIESGGLWPPHCIQDSHGARFHPDLNLPENTLIITKGVRFDQDQNSVFDQTGLAIQLRKDGVQHLSVGGLAEDVCVLSGVLDALQEGFKVTLITDATFPVTEEGGREAHEKMRLAGAQFVSAE